MANNRMYLVCNVCLPEGEKYDYEKWQKVSFHVAKWYPGAVGEWYTNATSFNFAESMDKFFEAHAHPMQYPGGVENPVRLDYEWVGTPIKERLGK